MTMTSSSLYIKDKHQFLKTLASKRRRPRQELPEDLSNLIHLRAGDKPTLNDVITRGGDYQNTFELNRHYWRRILTERRGYTKLRNYEHEAKNAVIAESIYEFILSSGGRFLQLDAKSGRWLVLSKKASMCEIHQGLNERYVPYFARLQRSAAVSRPDTTAFEAFLNNASSHQNRRSNCSLSQKSLSFLKSSGSNKHVMACVNNKHNNTRIPQVPISMRAYLEEKMNSAFSTCSNSRSRLACGSYSKRESQCNKI